MNDDVEAKQLHCPKSQRVDGPFHSFVWDGDDPYIVCTYCGERRSVLTGKVIR